MSSLLEHPAIDWSLLDRFRFDRSAFEAAATAIASGHLGESSSILRTQRLEPVDLVTDVSWLNGDARAKGAAALRAGELAALVLNGGMATRFGQAVKGLAEVYPGESFLSLKAKDVALANAQYATEMPLVLMNSFATAPATELHLTAQRHFGMNPRNLLGFAQSISLRMTPEGGLFLGADGKPSYHAPGHGDLFSAIRQSGVLAELLRRGCRTLFLSNIDNLGATIDPVILGHHLLQGRAMSVEVTAKRRTASGAWDKGGAPARVDGRNQIVEGFRLPEHLPDGVSPDFSTNNFYFDLAALQADIPLERHVVRKNVDGRPALQLESLACEASCTLATSFLRVPRDGVVGRFFPVKERQDLEAGRATLRARLAHGWALRLDELRELDVNAPPTVG